MMRPVLSLDGLQAWRAKDAKGQSCASCHSPDGIELTAFTESDLRRRILRHHSGDLAEQVVRIVTQNSNRLKFIGHDYRPFQPGGSVLPGKTPQERDGAFLANLAKQHPFLFKPISSLAQALEYQKEILAIDLRSVPIGIEVNRLSEDSALGANHATIANWFPDVPTFDSDQLAAVSDAYLQNPTEENLRKIDEKAVLLSSLHDQFSMLSLAKYRCLNLLQHEMRTGKQTSFLPPDNPFWQIAEVGRVYADSDEITLHVPETIVLDKSMKTTFKSQMRQLRLPWFWLGWIRDPSLTKSGLSRETLRGDYFCTYLEQDGPYMGHEAFMLTRKLAEQNRNPVQPNFPWEIQYTFFLANDPLIKREPKDPTAKELFRRLTHSSFVMSLYLLEQDLRARKKAYHPIPQGSQIKFLNQYLNDIHQPEAALVGRVSELLATLPTK